MLKRIHTIGAQAVVALGGAESVEAALQRLPLIGIVSTAQDAPTLAGTFIKASDVDVCVRMLSNGQPHRALPGTGSICTAVALRIEGTIAKRLARPTLGDSSRIAMPSGVIVVDATVEVQGDAPVALSGSLYRTARRLFDGHVYY